ncbi:MAG: hypothetical protein ACOYN2_04400 [Patescibacteria group bacterium]
MIHVFVTHDARIRDAAMAHFGLVEKMNASGVYQKLERILLWTESSPESLIERAFGEFAAGQVWILSSANVVSTEHEVGDIVLPNVFLPYDAAIESTSFTKENRDAFMRDPLFLSHYDEQDDIDFETFGLSIGGITVTKADGMSAELQEQVDFAYSADCVDPVTYPMILAAKKLERSEEVYPVLAMVKYDGQPEENAKIFGHLFHVVEFLQSPISQDDTVEVDLDDGFDDEEMDR